ncbi:MAG: polysaccharide biosynthesis C-terminal domain-containing protein, partial [Bacteroidales bacterium]|nr:polysaccharide biosynthesis C-terminal domain-containing protein [Bacteroidales bacterium]
IDRVIMIVFCSLLLWGNVTSKPFEIMWFIYIQTFAYAVTVLLALSIVLRKSSFQRPFIDMAFFKSIFKQSFPFALLHFFTSFHNRIDTVLMERILPIESGAQQAGIYASAFRLLDAGIIIAYLMSVICMPLFSNMIANKQKVNEIVKTSFILLFIYGSIIAVGSFFYSDELMNLLYVNHVSDSSAVYKILMLSILPITLTYVFGSLLTANGNLKELNIIAVIAVCMNLFLNVIFIPKYGAIGSAYVSLITQFFIIISEIYLTIKIFKFKWESGFLIKLGIFTAGVIAWNVISIHLPLHWAWCFCIMLAGSLVSVFISRLIKIKEVLALFHMKFNS